MKKNVETIKESMKRETKLERERKRESVCVCVCVLIFFGMNNLEGIVERGGNEVKRNLYENQDGGRVKVDERLKI